MVSGHNPAPMQVVGSGSAAGPGTGTFNCIVYSLSKGGCRNSFRSAIVKVVVVGVVVTALVRVSVVIVVRALQ